MEPMQGGSVDHPKAVPTQLSGSSTPISETNDASWNFALPGANANALFEDSRLDMTERVSAIVAAAASPAPAEALTCPVPTGLESSKAAKARMAEGTSIVASHMHPMSVILSESGARSSASAIASATCSGFEDGADACSDDDDDDDEFVSGAEAADRLADADRKREAERKENENKLKEELIITKAALARANARA